jgi:hypothetical protein
MHNNFDPIHGIYQRTCLHIARAITDRIHRTLKKERSGRARYWSEKKNKALDGHRHTSHHPPHLAARSPATIVRPPEPGRVPSPAPWIHCGQPRYPTDRTEHAAGEGPSTSRSQSILKGQAAELLKDAVEGLDDVESMARNLQGVLLGETGHGC